MTILILIGMAVLVGVLLLYVFELDVCCLKQETPEKHCAAQKNCFVPLCKMFMLLFF